MKNGQFPNGARTLRAKIDMASPNIWMRDPLLYRIRHAEHHHTGKAWCIYPMYDFAHCLSNYIEGVTHSICTLEFEVHRPLYRWILEQLELPRALPHQYEFARLSLGYTLMSKRKLLQLVQEKIVNGWDDPRMPTISGLRRRGVTASGLRHFAYNIGVTKYNGLTDVAVLEHAVRDDLNRRALRRLAVLRPIRVVLSNYPEGKVEEVDAEVRLYDRLFTVPEPDAGGDFKKFINPTALEVITARLEPSLREAQRDLRYQFERLAYFCLDPDSRPDKLVFNRTITLKDTWAKEAKRPNS